MRSIRFYIKFTIILAAVVGIASYSLIEARSLFERNNLMIEKPENASVVDEKMLNIIGRARNVADISVNGLPVFVDESGYFAVPYIASEGYNIVEVALKDKFGRVDKKTVEIVYKK